MFFYVWMLMWMLIECIWRFAEAAWLLGTSGGDYQPGEELWWTFSLWKWLPIQTSQMLYWGRFLQDSSERGWQRGWTGILPSGKLTFCYGKSPFSMGKSTISMAIFNSYVKLPEGTCYMLLGSGSSDSSPSWGRPRVAPFRTMNRHVLDPK